VPTPRGGAARDSPPGPAADPEPGSAGARGCETVVAPVHYFLLHAPWAAWSSASSSSAATTSPSVTHAQECRRSTSAW
jgi:hypothetical protein